MLYPLIFEPILKERVWGGRSLQRLYNKSVPPGTKIGEAWEISDREGDVSVIANGSLAGQTLHGLVEQRSAELLGEAGPVQGRFPLLLKIIDARENLSLQVHPPPEYAQRVRGEPKTEMWYVAEATASAELLVGLRREVKRSQFERKIGDGSVADCFHRIRVRVGDAMFLPSGRVHAIGAGNVVFEVQQNSDTTYRVFDWNRTGPDGQPRDLHIEHALQCIDFDDQEPSLIHSVSQPQGEAERRDLVSTPLFSVAEFKAPAGYVDSLGRLDRPVILAVVSGHLMIRHDATATQLALGAGQFCLVPASVVDAVVETESTAAYLFIQPGSERPKSAGGASADGEEGAAPSWEHYRSHPRRYRSGDELYRRGHIPSRRRVKKAITKRLTYAPLLKMLVLNAWFRAAFLLAVGMGLSVAVLLPRLWTVTPAGFLPEVKVSLLDLAQARMLRKGAEEAAAKGNLEAADYAWQSALANNPGDASLARGYLRNVMGQELTDPRRFRPALRNALWLLRLTGTNHVDLDLAVRLFDKFRVYELAYQALKPFAAKLDPELEPFYLKSLFFEEEMDQFARRWDQLGSAQQADPELQIFRAAYQAGWGPPGFAQAGRERLAAELGDASPHRIIANRLMLAVSARVGDVDTYGKSLQQLGRWQADNALDHAGYWKLLAATGRRQEALDSARAYAHPPKTSTEVLRLARQYRELGLLTEARGLLDSYAPQFVQDDELWIAYGNLLLDLSAWEHLGTVAQRMRQLPPLRARLEAFSDYLEGRAELGKGKRALADMLFDRASQAKFPDPGLALVAASEMVRLGFPTEASRILAELDAHPDKTEGYWQAVFGAATQLRDVERLVASAQALHEAQPQNHFYANRYAASLLAQRQEPDKAIRLTLQIFTAAPESVVARINHSLALLLNHRSREAERLLATLDLERLDAESRGSYHLARFELYYLQGKKDLAREVLSQIDRDPLYPPQRAWLERCQQELLPPVDEPALMSEPEEEPPKTRAPDSAPAVPEGQPPSP